MRNTTTFGQWLKQRRKALGLTQKDLAQQAGCAEVTLRKIEAGDLHPSAPLVASLAKALRVAEADLPGLLALARGADDDFSARARLLRPQRPHNLPAQLTPLIGRQHDVAAVRKRLLSDGARLVTLLGPPGVGKTRLALAVAEEVLEHFEHGAFFVRLGPVSDPALVPSAIAQALGLEMSGPNPPELQLRAWLEEKHLLLALDNFEQIVAAAPLVDDLLRRCPWLHVLVTSRQPLRVRGERQMMVRPLALPAAQPGASRLTGDDALRYAAVALFAERAEAVLPDFSVSDDNAAAVAELCRRLDGLPLAIELVAARVKLLPPAELLVRLHGPWLLSTDGLRDVSARQRTLRGAIGWSHDLLSPVEQTLFMRLAVFVGGCTLEAAEMMCEDVLSPGQVLDGIASLLDKNLLLRATGLHGQARYVMLETIREYGLERLAASWEEEAIRARHVNSLLRLIEQAEQSDPDPGLVLLADLLDDEIYNVRAALTWALTHDTQAALLLTAALVDRSQARGAHSEGEFLIDQVFALPGAAAYTPARAKALLQASHYQRERGAPERAQADGEESLAISQQLGHAQGEADALLALGRIAHTGFHNQDAARHYLEEALARYRTLDDAGGIAHALAVLSETALFQGDFAQARVLSEECLAVARQAALTYPWPYGILANVALAEGDLDRARLLYEQLLATTRPRNLKGTLLWALTELGSLAIRQGDSAVAHACLGEAAVFLNDLGDQYVWLDLTMAALAQAEGDYRGAVRLYRVSLAGVRNDQSLWGPCLLQLASQAARLGRRELVARLLGAVDLVGETVQSLYPYEQDDYVNLVEHARVHLGVESFDVLWNEGRGLTFEQAAEEAVSILEAALDVPEHSLPS